MSGAGKYGVDGSLYWSTTHWSHKNPWVDPMSYQNPEKNATWGNGDGYLLYPPTRKPPKEPLVKGPVNSIRFEMIREGLEDKEYLWLLRRAAGDRKVPELSLPDELVTTLVVFEHDARNLYDARRRLANAIERLSRR